MTAPVCRSPFHIPIQPKRLCGDGVLSNTSSDPEGTGSGRNACCYLLSPSQGLGESLLVPAIMKLSPKNSPHSDRLMSEGGMWYVCVPFKRGVAKWLRAVCCLLESLCSWSRNGVGIYISTHLRNCMECAEPAKSSAGSARHRSVWKAFTFFKNLVAACPLKSGTHPLKARRVRYQHGASGEGCSIRLTATQGVFQVVPVRSPICKQSFAFVNLARAR